MYHDPVLLKEAVDALVQDENGTYVDVTFGGGGHSKEILKRLSDKGRLIAFDRDLDSLDNAINDPRVELVNQNFLYMKNFLRYHKAMPVNGILADLGVSSHQFDVPERGFSFQQDHRLDMRMDQSQSLDAAEVINTYSAKQLTQLFKDTTDLKSPHKIAAAICNARDNNAITTTGQLTAVFAEWNLQKNRHKFFSQLFQALRIEVNRELDALKELLVRSAEVLDEEGRMVVISYHSHEDRLVKNFFRSGNFEGQVETDIYGNVNSDFKPLQQKVIVPGDEEKQRNPRSRSAKMRVGVRV